MMERVLFSAVFILILSLLLFILQILMNNQLIPGMFTEFSFIFFL